MNLPTPSHWDDVQLMAWADGELPPDQAAALEADIARDAGLAQRAALMQPTRALVREAYDARLNDAPVPDALRDKVLALVAHDRARRARAQAAPAPTVPRPRAAGGWREAVARLFSGFALPGAVAASVVFGSLGYVVGQSEAPPVPAGLTLAAGAPAPAALAALLDQLPSGTEGVLAHRALTMVASFRDARGHVCRDFSLAQPGDGRLEVVACRAPDGVWQLAYAALAPVDTGYTPASAGSALEAYLAAIGARQPLTEADERAALRRE